MGSCGLSIPLRARSARHWETRLDWNQKGPKGDAGPQGAAGPKGDTGAQGPALDRLARSARSTISRASRARGRERIRARCVSATDGKRDRGAGVAYLRHHYRPATLGLPPSTSLGGTLQIGLLGETPLPTSGWQFSGEIDSGGRVTIPGTSFQFTDVPFDATKDFPGFAGVHVIGTASFASTGVTGSLDPASGAASLSGGVYAVVTLRATAQILGQTVEIYAGTCSFGTVSSPISWALTTDPPGVPYSQVTGAVTLSSAFTAPSLDGCNPAIDPIYGFVLGIFAELAHHALGTSDPIVKAPEPLWKRRGSSPRRFPSCPGMQQLRHA